MRKLFCKLVLLLPLLLLAAGCYGHELGNQPDYSTQEGDGEMNEVLNQINTEEEASVPWAIELSHSQGRYRLNFMLDSDITRSACDVDFQTIERFLFSFGDFGTGHGFVLDRLHGMVHFNNVTRSALGLPLRYRSEFRQEDLDRLAHTLDEANVRNWLEDYRGRELGENVMGDGESWSVAMIFSDGTLMRRQGQGFYDDFFPPQHEWDILTNFINTIGAEIIDRHHAENAHDE